MFLMVLAHPGSPGHKAVKVFVVVVVNNGKCITMCTLLLQNVPVSFFPGTIKCSMN